MFCNRKIHTFVCKNTHQVITYKFFKNFEEAYFLSDSSSVHWEILEQFDHVIDFSLVFNPIMVEGYAALFSCTAVVQASDSITASM